MSSQRIWFSQAKEIKESLHEAKSWWYDILYRKGGELAPEGHSIFHVYSSYATRWGGMPPPPSSIGLMPVNGFSFYFTQINFVCIITASEMRSNPVGGTLGCHVLALNKLCFFLRISSSKDDNLTKSKDYAFGWTHSLKKHRFEASQWNPWLTGVSLTAVALQCVWVW